MAFEDEGSTPASNSRPGRESTAPGRAEQAPEPTLLKIGEFAERSGTNLRTLRYYEEVGLLQPAGRSKGGFRFYRATDVNRLNMIRRLQDLGLHLDRVRELMSTRDEKLPHAELIRRVRTVLEEQDGLLRERVARLESQRKLVAEALDKLDQCLDCVHHPQGKNNFCEPCAEDGRTLPVNLSALF